MIGKVVTGCVAILSYHTATQDRGSECRDFGFISRIVTALTMSILKLCTQKNPGSFFNPNAGLSLGLVFCCSFSVFCVTPILGQT